MSIYREGSISKSDVACSWHYKVWWTGAIWPKESPISTNLQNMLQLVAAVFTCHKSSNLPYFHHPVPAVYLCWKSPPLFLQMTLRSHIICFKTSVFLQWCAPTFWRHVHLLLSTSQTFEQFLPEVYLLCFAYSFKPQSSILCWLFANCALPVFLCSSFSSLLLLPSSGSSCCASSPDLRYPVFLFSALDSRLVLSSLTSLAVLCTVSTAQGPIS